MNFCVCPPFSAPKSDTDLVIFPPQKEYMQEWEAKTFLEKAAAFAKENGIWVLTPAFSLGEHLVVCLINQAGKRALLQRACRLTPALRGSYQPFDSLQAVETPFGKLMILWDVDVYDPALTDRAVQEHCDAIVSVQYIPDVDFSKERILFGAWRASQQTGLPVLNVSNQGVCVTEPCKALPQNGSLNGFLFPFTDRLPFEGTV